MKKRFKAALQKPAGIFVLVTSFLAQIQEKNPDIYLNGRNPLETYRDFVLPFPGITRTPYKIQSTVYTKEQAQKKAVQQLRIYEQKLLNKGIRIADSRLSVTFDSTNCTVQGTLTVDEKAERSRI